MNPRNLFSLSASQRSRYLIQPDSLNDFNWYEHPEEYEHPPYIDKGVLRFWYNTQDYGFPSHWHNAQEMIVPLEEGYTVTCGCDVYRLEPGDILLIPPGEVHSMEAPPEGARFVFLYELDLLGRISDFSFTRSLLAKPVLINSDTSPIYRKQIGLVLQIADHYWSDSRVRQMHIYSCMMEFYACYTDYCVSSTSALSDGHSARPLSSAVPSASPGMEVYCDSSASAICDSHPARQINSQKLHVVLQYMEQHYSEKLVLEDIAGMAGLSVFYFTRIFKQYTGHAFYEQLTILRIKASETLLRDTSDSISHIALSCGFTTLSSFNRSFRNIHGCTPSAFRRR